MKISRRRRAAFTMAAVGLSLAVISVTLVAADLYLHRRAERSAGLNRWGYRGPVVGAKNRDEVRIAFLGGSTMFGYGVTWDRAIPALVEARLNAEVAPVRSVNLGLNSEGAFSFIYTLQDFDYIEPDIVVLYEGYNDLQGDEDGGNTSLLRHQSAVFRLTGYYPILPLALRERAMLMRHGDLATAYAAARGELPGAVFRPGLAQRTVATALETATVVGDSVGGQLGRLSGAVPREVTARSEAGCAPPWSAYCQSTYRAIRYALSRGARVMVGSQPTVTELRREAHIEQQKVLVEMLARHFSSDGRVTHVDLRNAIDLRDPSLSFDQMHLTDAGNQIAAARISEALVPAVTLARATRRSTGG